MPNLCLNAKEYKEYKTKAACSILKAAVPPVNKLSLLNDEERSIVLEHIKNKDPLLYPLVIECYKRGISICAGCQGHPEKNDKFGYVTFDELNNPKFRDILKYISQNEALKIGFSNYTITSPLICSIYWPIEDIQKITVGILGVIDKKNSVKYLNVPEFVCLMEKFMHVCTKYEIEASIRKIQVAPKKSTGEISMIMHGNRPNLLSSDFVKIFGLFKGKEFSKDSSTCLHKINWENIDDELVTSALKKAIKIFGK